MILTNSSLILNLLCFLTLIIHDPQIIWVKRQGISFHEIPVRALHHFFFYILQKHQNSCDHTTPSSALI